VARPHCRRIGRCHGRRRRRRRNLVVSVLLILPLGKSLMPIAGSVVHQQLMDAYAEAQAQLDAEREQVDHFDDTRDDLNEDRGNALVSLAEHYLPELTREAIESTWSELRPRVTNLLLQKGTDATVTVCHSRTRDLPSITRQADILVAAIGRAEFVTAEMVKEGAAVIDVGINRVEDATRERGYRLVGDVDFEVVAEKAGWITPVPGGVGPMTIAMLLRNTLTAAQRLAALRQEA